MRAPPEVVVLLARVIGGSDDTSVQHISVRHLFVEDRRADSWFQEGQRGPWNQAHVVPIRAQFTPFCLSGPSKHSSIKNLCVTKGRFVSTGLLFELIDKDKRANA